MKNIRKNTHSSESHKLNIALPDVLNMDDIAVLTDDSLIERLRTLESEREHVLDFNVDPINWEVEIAYLRREFQLRRSRHQHHESYLHQLDREADEAARLENQYPVADLDNSGFMFFN